MSICGQSLRPSAARHKSDGGDDSLHSGGCRGAAQVRREGQPAAAQAAGLCQLRGHHRRHRVAAGDGRGRLVARRPRRRRRKDAAAPRCAARQRGCNQARHAIPPPAAIAATPRSTASPPLAYPPPLRRRLLVKAGSPIDAYTQFRETPLHLAVRHEAQADLAMLHRRVERPASGTQQPARLRQASRRGEVLPRSAGALLASRTR